MAALRCPKHGPKIALIFCEHAGTAVDERRVVPVYLQRNEWGWHTVCEDCVRRADRAQALADADYLVCVECAIEWAEIADNDYVQRSQDPHPEFPPDLAQPVPATAGDTAGTAGSDMDT